MGFIDLTGGMEKRQNTSAFKIFLKDKTPWEKLITNFKMILLTVLHWFPGNLGFGCLPYAASRAELCPALLSQAGICGKLWATA